LQCISNFNSSGWWLKYELINQSINHNHVVLLPCFGLDYFMVVLLATTRRWQGVSSVGDGEQVDAHSICGRRFGISEEPQ
jgi:hypothetical protein